MCCARGGGAAQAWGTGSSAVQPSHLLPARCGEPKAKGRAGSPDLVGGAGLRRDAGGAWEQSEGHDGGAVRRPPKADTRGEPSLKAALSHSPGHGGFNQSLNTLSARIKL